MLSLPLALGVVLFAPDPASSGEPAPAAASEPAQEPPPPTLPMRPGAPAQPDAGSDDARASTAPAPAEPAPAEPAPPGIELQPSGAAPAETARADEEPEYELRGREDLPYAATAARKSANLRGNTMLVRPYRAPLFSAGAVARLGVLLAGGRDVVQPYGYGFAAQLRGHFVSVFKSRFGLEVHAGHTRYPERVSFELDDSQATTISRAKLLSSTDVSLGPSLEIPIGPVFVQFGAGVGVGVSSLVRPRSADVLEDESVSAVNVLLRGGLQLGVPVFNGHGFNLGAGAQHIFSPSEVAVVLDVPDGEQTRPFATALEVFAGYTIWF